MDVFRAKRSRHNLSIATSRFFFVLSRDRVSELFSIGLLRPRDITKRAMKCARINYNELEQVLD
jgi:hypothetical protein